MAVTRGTLSVSLKGKEHNKEDHTEDVDQDSGSRNCSSSPTAGPGQPFPGVSDSGGGLVPASLSSVASFLYSLIGTMRENGDKESRGEEASVEGRGGVQAEQRKD